MSYEGKDISHFQTDSKFNYPLFIAENKFIIIKFGQSNYIDSSFRNFYNKMKAYGLKTSVYYYGTCLTVAKAKEQAQWFVQHLKEEKVKPDFSVFFDIEDDIMLHVSAAQASLITDAFCSTVNNAGFSCGIYSSYFPLSTLDSTITSKYPLWVAYYGIPKGDPVITNKFPTAKIHQYKSASGRPSYNGDIDFNYAIDDSFIDNGQTGSGGGLIGNKFYYAHPLGNNAPNAKITTYTNHTNFAIDLSLRTNGSNKSTLGTPLYSMTSGTVVSANYGYDSYKNVPGSYGNCIVIQADMSGYIQYANGTQFIRYAHLVEPNEYPEFPRLTVGQHISIGEIIGGMGASGHTEGSEGCFVHCHIEMLEAQNGNGIIITNPNIITNYDDYRNRSIPSPSYDENFPIISGNNFYYNRGIFSQPNVQIFSPTPSYIGAFDEEGIVPGYMTFATLTADYINGILKSQFIGGYPKQVSELYDSKYDGLRALTNSCIREFSSDKIMLGLYAKLLRTWYMYYNSSFTKDRKNKFHQNPDIKTFALFFQEMRDVWGYPIKGDPCAKMAEYSDSDYRDFMEIVYKNFRYGGYYLPGATSDEIDCACSCVSSNSWPVIENKTVYLWRRNGDSKNFVLWRSIGDCCIASNINRIYNENANYIEKTWKEIILE